MDDRRTVTAVGVTIDGSVISVDLHTRGLPAPGASHLLDVSQAPVALSTDEYGNQRAGTESTRYGRLGGATALSTWLTRRVPGTILESLAVGRGAVSPSYKGYRFPAEIVAHCVWLYHRFPLSYREVEELMLARGVTVSHETIRQWCVKFGPAYARELRRRRPLAGDK